MLDMNTALDRYEQEIIFLTRKYPRFWREDARQELRLAVLEAQERSGGKMDDDRMELEMLTRLRDFATLEYNGGKRDVPKEDQSLDLIVNTHQLNKRIAELNVNMKAETDGDKVVIHNKLA